jgi:hypothetical protein
MISIGSIGPTHAEERPEHYQVTAPTSVFEAVQTLSKKTIQIQQASRQQDLHRIHKESYHLEAAVEYLQEHDKGDAALLNRIANHIEKIHHASEDNEPAVVSSTIPKLTVEVSKLQAAMLRR